MGLMRNIIIVDLSDDQTTNEDVALLASSLPAVERLLLWGSQLTDAGLEHVKDMASLERIHLSGTFVSAKGRKDLQRGKKISVYWRDKSSHPFPSSEF